MKLQQITENLKYPVKAGQNSPPGVRAEIERYRQFPDNVKTELPLLYYLLGRDSPDSDKKMDYKVSKKDANYLDESPYEHRRCDNCKFYYDQVATDEYVCSQVRGEVLPEGWCKFWKKPEKDDPHPS